MRSPAPSAPRPRNGGHQSYRNQAHQLMYLGHTGRLIALTACKARRLVSSHGSIRSAAKAIGIPKSTLFDLVNQIGKRR